MTLLYKNVALVFCLLTTIIANAQERRIAKTWQDVATVPAISQTRYIVPTKYRTLQLNLPQLRSQLTQVQPADALQRSNAPIFAFPMPDGSIEEFRIWESSCMEPALAATYPMIKTYQGQGIQHPEAQITIDASPYGFHAMAFINEKTVFIDPYAHLQSEYFISYFKSDYPKPAGKGMSCNVLDKNGIEITADRKTEKHEANEPLNYQNRQIQAVTGPQLRSYRLALTCTGEYANFHSPTNSTAQVLAAMITSVNRVNSVYERDIAVHYNLVARDSLLIYHTTNDGFANSSGGTMLNQNQSRTDSVIGSANYDMGHIFSTGGGGIAQLGCVCGNSKARGVTGSPAPVGDAFDIDYVVHEMGHQNGGNHTFNGSQGSCGGNRRSATAFEPGSGVTIMAYAGICGTDDIDQHSIDIFHTGSFDETTAFTQGTGNSCAAITQSGNHTPTCSASIATTTIPAGTPFELTGAASDVDGDALTYCWEEIDLGSSTGPIPTTGNGPVFKSYNPSTSPTRTFPTMNTILTGTAELGNTLVAYARSYKFRMTVRDNHAGCGGSIYTPTVNITAVATAGPFVVTVPNTTGIIWPIGATKAITWNVASTDIAPVNCPNVDIFLSIDGGTTFNQIAAGVPNTGSYDWLVSNTPSVQCRVKVKAANNIFFDINDKNFEIKNVAPTFLLATADTLKTTCIPNSVDYIINTQAISGFSNPITFSTTSGVPAGATVSFSANPVTPGQPVTMTVTLSPSVIASNYNIRVNALSGTISLNQTVKLYASAAAPAATSLLTPLTNETLVPSTPNFTWSAATDATSYLLEVATDAAFATIVATKTTTATNATLSTALAEGVNHFWRVKSINDCGNILSGTRSFTTAFYVCNTYNATTGLPATITATGAPTIDLTLNIPDSFIIADVDVTNVNITHSWIHDLTLDLKNGTTTVSLLPQICDRENDLLGLSFNDAATTAAANAPCPPANIDLKPASPLAAFNGRNAQGTWTFTIKDLVNQDGGSATSWSLKFCSMQSSPIIATETTSPSTAKVLVYPNPTNGVLNVLLSNIHEKATVSVFNIQGQLMAQTTALNTANFQTTDWASGMYIVQVHSTEGIFTHKVMVTK